MKTKFCRYCGKELGESWNACPNCGSKISESASQEKAYTNPFQMRFKNHSKQEHEENVQSGNKLAQTDILGILAISFGILSLVFGFVVGVLVGLLVGIVLEIVFGILAMIFGGAALYQGETNSRALIGLILGGFNLIIQFYFMPFVWFRFSY